MKFHVVILFAALAVAAAVESESPSAPATDAEKEKPNFFGQIGNFFRPMFAPIRTTKKPMTIPSDPEKSSESEAKEERPNVFQKVPKFFFSLFAPIRTTKAAPQDVPTATESTVEEKKDEGSPNIINKMTKIFFGAPIRTTTTRKPLPEPEAQDQPKPEDHPEAPKPDSPEDAKKAPKPQFALPQIFDGLKQVYESEIKPKYPNVASKVDSAIEQGAKVQRMLVRSVENMDDRSKAYVDALVNFAKEKYQSGEPLSFADFVKPIPVELPVAASAA